MHLNQSKFTAQFNPTHSLPPTGSGRLPHQEPQTPFTVPAVLAASCSKTQLSHLESLQLATRPACQHTSEVAGGCWVWPLLSSTSPALPCSDYKVDEQAAPSS